MAVFTTDHERLWVTDEGENGTVRVTVTDFDRTLSAHLSPNQARRLATNLNWYADLAANPEGGEP